VRLEEEENDDDEPVVIGTDGRTDGLVGRPFFAAVNAAIHQVRA